MSRRRWVYTQAGAALPEPIEVTPDFTGAETRAQTVTEGLVHGSNVAPDGTDISTRKRRREWMARTGSADHSDYTEHLAKAKAQREAFWTQGPADPTRPQDIYRAIQDARRKRK